MYFLTFRINLRRGILPVKKRWPIIRSGLYDTTHDQIGLELKGKTVVVHGVRKVVIRRLL